MNSKTKRVLIVDDSPDDIHFVMESISQGFAVVAATSGEKALQIAAKEPKPDIILMDVDMPGMDGYEVCRRLKEDESTREIEVIFLSSHDTTEEKLAGYDVGGSDYLIKPVQSDLLRQKIKLSISNRDAHIQSSAEISSTREMAMTALTNAGELGVTINFMRHSFSTDSLEALARLVVEATTNYGLESGVAISLPDETFYASSNEPIQPLEQELLSRLKGGSRITERGSRLVLNFGDISQLIKNLPEDEDKRGRLRDHLAILLEGAEARVEALKIQKKMAQVVTGSNQTLLMIKGRTQEQKQAAMGIMDNVMHEIESAFLTYGLTEEQEKKILDIVKKGVDESLENLERGHETDQQLHAIIDDLGQFSSR